MVRQLSIDGDDQGDFIWETEEFEQLWITTGQPPMRTTSRRSTAFTERTRSSNNRNRASTSEAERNSVVSGRAAEPEWFTVRRIVGAGDLLVSEYIITHDGRLSYTVSIMEFLDGKVARETQYFAEPFEPRASRGQWVERMPGTLPS